MLFQRVSKFTAVMVLLGIGNLCGEEGVSPGASRAAVIARYGRPSGTMALGAKEILSYPNGRVIVVNGLVERFEGSEVLAAKPPFVTSNPSLQSNPAAPGVIRTGAGAKTAWLRDLAEAKAQAIARDKPILVVFTAIIPQCSWSPTFLSALQDNAELNRRLSTDYVKLLFNFSDPPENVFPLYNLQKEIFGDEPMPLAAILSPDGKRAAKLEMRSMDPANIVPSLLRMIKAAEAAPMAEISLVSSGAPTSDSWSPRSKLIGVGAALFAVGFIIKKLRG